MKNKIIALALTFTTGALILAGCGSSASGASAGTSSSSGSKDAGTLNVFVWTEYVSQSVFDEFTKKTGIKVNVSTYSSNEDMLAKVKSETEGTYDIVQPSDYMVELMIGQDMLQKLDQTKLTNLSNIGESYLNPSYDPGNAYSVPYQGGVGAIAVNTAKVDLDIDSYDDLFDSALKNSLVVLDDYRAVIALKEPENYEARSNLMWAATLGLNHILTVGKGGAWSCHPIEHELSAFYDVTHGYGLAVITPAWMRYVLSSKTKDRFAMYAENVWEITEESLEESGAHTDGEVSGMNHTVHDNLDKRDFTMEIAKAGIEKTAEFFRSMGLPTKLSDMGIGDEHFSEMAIEAERISKIATRAYAHLTADDIVRIFEMCR